MGPVASAVQAKINAELNPTHLQLLNESGKHAAGMNNPSAETHFTLVIVSDAFVSLAAVARHRLIYKLLAEELNNGMHALSLQLYSPAEWQEQTSQEPKPTPPCAKT